jgi:Flp pilus assembly protein TadD
VLRATLGLAPDDAGLHHALGLVLVRLKRSDEALGEFRRAAELEPDQPRYAYVYAVGLHSAGRGLEAMAALKENPNRHPSDRDTLLALINFSRDAGDIPTALEYAERLARIEPTNRELTTLVETLRRQSRGGGQ